MAPIVEDEVDERLKSVIQDLYEIQTCIHGYLGPQTRDVLVGKITDLTHSLQTLSSSASTLPPNWSIPPEIIDYVEDGRNPDIYTREFVENVQKLNAVLKGKVQAFGAFERVFGEELVGAGMATQEEVETILRRDVEGGVVKVEEGSGEGK